MTSTSSEHAQSEHDADLKELESEVNSMAEKIIEYRSSLPEQLKSRFAALLEAQRPAVKLTNSLLDPGTSNAVSNKGGVTGELEVDHDRDTAEKIQLLKENIAINASAMPVVLKRMEDCISKIDNLESCRGAIHPVFKRKRSG